MQRPGGRTGSRESGIAAIRITLKAAETAAWTGLWGRKRSGRGAGEHGDGWRRWRMKSNDTISVIENLVFVYENLNILNNESIREHLDFAIKSIKNMEKEFAA